MSQNLNRRLKCILGYEEGQRGGGERRQFIAKFKARVAMALCGDRTIQANAPEHHAALAAVAAASDHHPQPVWGWRPHTPCSGDRRMTDIVDRKRRSAMMARIRGRDTKPELAVRHIAHRMGLRFRLHRKDLPGRPDLVFPKHRLAVFVHGCFWHRHEGCPYASNPKSRIAFWTEKFAANVERDARQEAALRALGWRVLVIWQCEIGDEGAVERRLVGLIGRGATTQKPESTLSVTNVEPRVFTRIPEQR